MGMFALSFTEVYQCPRWNTGVRYERTWCPFNITIRCMKALFLSVLLFGFFCVHAQGVGPPYNVGREYGNPKMPLMVSHLAGANKERLKRANKNSRHSIFGKILCFRKLCRIQSGHSASLRAISFKKFRKKVARNAKKGLYKRTQIDSTYKRKPVVTPVVV